MSRYTKKDILELVEEEDGTLCFQVSSQEDDFFFDDIGSELKIRQLQKEKAEFLQALELFYRVFFLNEAVGEDIT